MSAFDKLVAGWVKDHSQTSTLPKETKTAILHNITHNLETYRQLERPGESPPPSEAPAPKQPTPTEEEANLPPLPPVPPGKKSAKRPKAKESGVAKKESKKPKKAPGVKIEVKNVDLEFEEEVKKVLEEVEVQEEEAEPPQPPPPNDNNKEQEKSGKEEEGAGEVKSEVEEEEERPLQAESSPEEELLPLQTTDSFSHERKALEAFTFGDTTPSSPPQAHQEDPVGSFRDDEDEVDNESPLPLDDREDDRRRTLQMGRVTNRASVFDAEYADRDTNIQPAETPKSKDSRKTIVKSLENHFLFSFLDDADLSQIAAVMDIATFEAGTTILEKGEYNNLFYLLLGGVVQETKDGESSEKQLSRGDSFNDIALMYSTPSESTFTAVEYTKCATIDRRTYKVIISTTMEERRRRYESWLSTIPSFAILTADERSRLAEALQRGSYIQGDVLIKAGSRVRWLHVLVEGQLEVRGTEGEHITFIQKGECVGHIEFLYHHLSVAEVVVSSETATTAKLARRAFDKLIGQGKEIMSSEVQTGSGYEYYHTMMRGASRPPEDVDDDPEEIPQYLKDSIGSPDVTELIRSIREEKEEKE